MKNQILFFKFLSLAGLLTMSGYSFAAMQDQSQEILAQDQLLADEQIVLDEDEKKHDEPAIIVAVKQGNVQEVKKLLQEGVDVNAKDASERTALMYAVQTFNVALIKLLLQAGANVNEKNDEDGPILVQVIMNILRRLEKNDYGSKLKISIKKAKKIEEIKQIGVAIIDLLLEAGADVNARMVGGTSVLMFAVLFSEVPIVEKLLQKGADVNARDDNDPTVLMAAVSKSSAAMVTLLLQAGADINAKDNTGKTALTYAKERNSKGVIDVLKQAGAQE